MDNISRKPYTLGCSYYSTTTTINILPLRVGRWEEKFEEEFKSYKYIQIRKMMLVKSDLDYLGIFY